MPTRRATSRTGKDAAPPCDLGFPVGVGAVEDEIRIRDLLFGAFRANAGLPRAGAVRATGEPGVRHLRSSARHPSGVTRPAVTTVAEHLEDRAQPMPSVPGHADCSVVAVVAIQSRP